MTDRASAQHSDTTKPAQSVLEKYPSAWGDAASAAYIPLRDDPQSNYTDKMPQRHVTDLEGKACKSDIPDGKAPELTSGKNSKGCEFKDLKGVKDGKLDMPSIYDQAQQSSFHLDIRGRISQTPTGVSGSGVAVGREGDKCFVATDNHVVGGVNNLKVDRAYASIDNQSFPAHKIWSDVPKDLAILSVDMSKNPELCKPATISEKPNPVGRAVGAGFPEGSNALTLSPMHLLGQAPLDQALGPPDPHERGADDPHRVAIMSDGNTHEGQSGGGVFDKKKELVGLIGGGVPEANDMTYINKLNRKQIMDAIAKHHNE